MGLRWEFLAGYGPLFLHGLVMTVLLTAVSLTLGMALGLTSGLVSSAGEKRVHSPWGWLLAAARWVVRAYVTFFRGTPLFVQVLLVHFALMPILVHPDGGWLLSGETARDVRQNCGAFFTGALVLTLNADAYISDIFRAGILSIAACQWQAAHALGLNHRRTLRLIILPQAFRRMVPAFVNEAVTLTKDSSLVSAIGLAELALAARTVAGAYSRYWEPYLAISAVYLLLTWLLSLLAKRLEVPAHLRGC